MAMIRGLYSFISDVKSSCSVNLRRFDGLKSITEEKIAQTTQGLSAAKEQEREQAGLL